MAYATSAIHKTAKTGSEEDAFRPHATRTNEKTTNRTATPVKARTPTTPAAIKSGLDIYEEGNENDIRKGCKNNKQKKQEQAEQYFAKPHLHRSQRKSENLAIKRSSSDSFAPKACRESCTKRGVVEDLQEKVDDNP
jgi:hypothetical protein